MKVGWLGHILSTRFTPGTLATFLPFLPIFTHANILKSGKYVEKSRIHHDPCLPGRQL
jgi:hypothetical protein